MTQANKYLYSLNEKLQFGELKFEDMTPELIEIQQEADLVKRHISIQKKL